MSTDFIKIRTSVLLDRGKRITQDQLDEIYAEEERLRELLILPLNEALGTHNWALQFSIIDTKEYYADLYLDDKSKFNEMRNIIKENISDRILDYWYRGTISEYIGNR